MTNRIEGSKQANDDYRQWAEKIPAIHFKSDWEVTILPPYLGAVVRFHVRRRNSKQAVSVYLDCYESLGFFGSPYWEIYDGDNIDRYAINDVAGLLEGIDNGLQVSCLLDA